MSGLILKQCWCEYCDKEFKSQNGLNGHKPYCKLNPNKINAWNKGLTQDTDNIVKQYTESMTKTKNSLKFKENNNAWNKGLTRETDERVRKNLDASIRTQSSPEHKKIVSEKIHKKYGGKHFTQTTEYKENMKSVLFKKYGVEHITHVPEIFEKMMKNRYKRKEVILPSGKIIKVQGYEHYAIDILLNYYNITESDIVTGAKHVPNIHYMQDNKKHRYYPDIYVKSWNKIIEVKSTYTLENNKRKNKLKQQATNKLGFKHEVWLISSNSNLIERISDLNEYYKR